MVADVTRKEREADAWKDGSLRTYKDQLGYGMHVIMTMFTLYMLLFTASKAFTTSKASQHFAGKRWGTGRDRRCSVRPLRPPQLDARALHRPCGRHHRHADGDHPPDHQDIVHDP